MSIVATHTRTTQAQQQQSILVFTQLATLSRNSRHVDAISGMLMQLAAFCSQPTRYECSQETKKQRAKKYVI